MGKRKYTKTQQPLPEIKAIKAAGQSHKEMGEPLIESAYMAGSKYNILTQVAGRGWAGDYFLSRRLPAI